MKFAEFMDRTNREAKKQLTVIKKLLEQNGFEVKSYLDKRNDPHIFLKSNEKDLSFAGVRIYRMGGNILYRIQRESHTHPYGKAYILHLEDEFNELVSENGNEEKAGHKTIKYVVEEFKRFFKESGVAEKELNELDQDGSPTISIRPSNMDYVSSISSNY